MPLFRALTKVSSNFGSSMTARATLGILFEWRTPLSCLVDIVRVYQGRGQSPAASSEADWHILEDNLLRQVFTASDSAAKKRGRLVCRSWQRMVGLTVTSFKTKTADHFNQAGAVTAGQALLPHIISPQRLLQLLPNVQLLDLREGVQTQQLLASKVLVALTAITKLSLKFQPSQLQPALASLCSLPTNLCLEVSSPGSHPMQLTAGHFPARMVELKLSDANICLQSMHLASTLTTLTALHLSDTSLHCPCCRPVVPLLAACTNLNVLSLDHAALSDEVFGLQQLSVLTQLTSLSYCGSHPAALHVLQAVGSTLKKVNLALKKGGWGGVTLGQVFDSVSTLDKLTFLHLDMPLGSWDLAVLSFLPHLESLNIKVVIDDADAMSGASGRVRALSFSSRLQSVVVGFTHSNKTCVALFTCQLFAHALHLQSVQFTSQKASRFVTPGQQPYCTVVDLSLQCINLTDQGLIDTIGCFPNLTSVAVTSSFVTMVGLQALTSLSTLQSLDIGGCDSIKAASLKDFVVTMRHLSVLRLAPQVAKALSKHKRKTRQDLLLDDRVCRQM